MVCRFLGVLLGLALVFAPRLARAGNEDEFFVGNQAAMVGGAVSAVVHDSSSTWYNPAGLGGIERDQVDISATVYTLRLYRAPKFIEAVSGESDEGSVAEFVVAPSQIAYVRRLSPKLSLGLGYFMPRSTNYVLRESLEAGRSAARSTWQISAAIAEAHHTGAAALGWALTDRIRVGASLMGTYVASTQSISLFGSVLQNRQQAAATSVSVIGTTARITFRPVLGMQLDLTDALKFGVSIRGPELMVHDGADSNANAIVTSQRDPAMPVLGTNAEELSQGSDVAFVNGGRAGLSLAYRFSKGWVSAEVDIQPKFRREALEIDRRTTINARGGVYYAFLPSVALGLGVFSDRAVEAKSWDFVTGSGDYYGGTLGVELSNEHLLAPNERVNSLIFTSVFALRYAFSDGDFGTTVVNPDNIESFPFESQKNSLFVHEIGLYVGSGLRF